VKTNVLFTLILMLSTIMSLSSFASERKCTVNAFQFEKSTGAKFETEVKNVYQVNTWQDCYKEAINLAKKYKLTEIKKHTYSRRWSDSTHFDQQTWASSQPWPKTSSVNLNVVNFFSWRYHDASLTSWRSSNGQVTRLSDPNSPEKN